MSRTYVIDGGESERKIKFIKKWINKPNSLLFIDFKGLVVSIKAIHYFQFFATDLRYLSLDISNELFIESLVRG